MKKKDLVEMLEKEANLILKQIALFVTIVGAIVSFLVHNVTVTLDTEKLNIVEKLMIGAELMVVVFLLGTLFGWFIIKLGRLNQVTEKIREINENRY